MLLSMSTFISAAVRPATGLTGSAMLRRSLAVFPILAALSMLWAVASPLMSIPDEPAHTIKAASVARGQLIGVSGNKQSDLMIVQVPEYIAVIGNQTCPAGKANVTADCALPIDGTARDLVDAVTSAGNYNPMYYAVVGLPSRILTGATAIYAMRAVSALLCAGFLALAVGAAASMRRPFWPTTGVLVAVTPMLLYLNGSINPNALEIVTTASLFLSACLVFENSKNLATVKTGMVVVGISGAVLANTRALSLLWLAFAVVAAVLIHGWKPLVAVAKNRLGQASIAFIALGCMASLAWLVVANSFQSLVGTPTEITQGQAIATMLDLTFAYSTGYIGIMGWLDTPLPGAVYAFWNFAFAAIIIGGLSVRRLRSRTGVILVLAGVIILPAILQAQVVESLGYIWQGRYLLALFVLLLMVCGVAMRTRTTPTGQWAKSLACWVIAGAIGVHFYAFIYVLRRYTVGIQGHTNWLEMFEPMWQPPFTWQLLSVAYLVVLVFGGVIACRTLFPVVPRSNPTENILSNTGN